MGEGNELQIQSVRGILRDVLSDRSQTKRSSYFMVPLMEGTRKIKLVFRERK